MTAVRRPTTLDSIDPRTGHLRAGGTDLHARQRLGVEQIETVVDLGDVGQLYAIRPTSDGGWWIGAMERISTVATHDALSAAYPALCGTAGTLANPHIRQMATMGGNLLQRTRCPYYRHPDIDCYKSGGDDCPARHGDHRHGVIFDLGPCVAPHPSSIAMALLTYDSEVTIHPGTDRPIADLYGDGSDPTRDHLLEPEAILTGVQMPPPTSGELASYRRATSRSYAEWPAVEAVCRLTVTDHQVTLARVAVGGVAPIPLRLHAVEEALVGQPANRDSFQRAAALATTDSQPLPQSAYKQALLLGTLIHVLDEALAGAMSPEGALHERGLAQEKGSTR